MSPAKLDDTPEASGEQESGRVPPLQTYVDRETRQEIMDALTRAGFESGAEGMRVVLKAFARSPAVQDAVRDNLGVVVMGPKDSAA
jgi:hypothetical protein